MSRDRFFCVRDRSIIRGGGLVHMGGGSLFFMQTKRDGHKNLCKPLRRGVGHYSLCKVVRAKKYK
jgi:hypothetical protein